MGEFRKAKRPGPLPMHQAIRAAKFSRKVDELMARDRALEKQHEVNLRVLKAWTNVMSAPPGNGCVGASILPREAAGTSSPSLNKNPIKEA